MSQAAAKCQDFRLKMVRDYLQKTYGPARAAGVITQDVWQALVAREVMGLMQTQENGQQPISIYTALYEALI